MELSYMELREQICDVCHKMWQLGWVAANDGNVSVKLPDGTFLATPAGMSRRDHIDSLLSMREGYHVTGRHPGYKKYSSPGERS